MITIRKDILSNATPQQIRDQTANLSAPLRDDERALDQQQPRRPPPGGTGRLSPRPALSPPPHGGTPPRLARARSRPHNSRTPPDRLMGPLYLLSW